MPLARNRAINLYNSVLFFFFCHVLLHRLLSPLHSALEAIVSSPRVYFRQPRFRRVRACIYACRTNIAARIVFDFRLRGSCVSERLFHMQIAAAAARQSRLYAGANCQPHGSGKKGVNDAAAPV